MWIVSLVRLPMPGIYRSGFFPRKVYYKKDALLLAKEVLRNDGLATVKKEVKGVKAA